MGLRSLLIPEAHLYVSEPPPHWFGNGKNEEAIPLWSNKNWLKSRFHFSFAEYRNPKNTQFGCLRVMNDDLVQGQRGFGTHPHRDVEIVTYIVDGVLTHADSTGTRESLGRGSVQFMTAGTGIQHSEHNLQDSPLRFIQIWITPRSHGLTPTYGGFDGATADAQAARRNALSQLVGDRAAAEQHGAPVQIAQDCSLFVAELDAGRAVEFPLRKGRQAYLLCVEGTLSAGGGATDDDAPLRLARHDAAEWRGEGTLRLAAEEGAPAHLLLIEMAEGAGGRGPGQWPLHM